MNGNPPDTPRMSPGLADDVVMVGAESSNPTRFQEPALESRRDIMGKQMTPFLRLVPFALFQT